MKREIWGKRLAIGALAGLATYLVFFFPYATGYGAERVPLIASLQNLWKYPDWQHAMLAPLIVAGLLIYKRREIFVGPATGSWWGFPAVLVGFFFYWVGYKTNVYYFGFGAVQILLGAGVIWILGWGYFRRLFFPWCFVAFTWPLYFLTDILAFKMRVLMIQVSSGFLKLVGVANVRSGTSIQSPPDFDAGIEQGARFALDIADPCSGIRSLFALMMVAALYGYLMLRKPWQRVGLFLSAVPLAVLGNFVRVNLLVFGSMILGADIAVGKDGATSNFHFLAGIAVFVVALGSMVMLAKILKGGGRIRREKAVVRKVRKEPTEKEPVTSENI